jgi:hypothetical protein
MLMTHVHGHRWLEGDMKLEETDIDLSLSVTVRPDAFVDADALAAVIGDAVNEYYRSRDEAICCNKVYVEGDLVWEDR